MTHARTTSRQIIALLWRAVPILSVGVLLLQPATADPLLPETLKNTASPSWSYEGRAAIEYRDRGNFDLDETASDDLHTLEPEASVALAYHPDENKMVLLEMETSKVFLLEAGPKERERPEVLELKQLYFHLFDPSSQTALLVGRQEFKDDIEWLFDEELDGVRVRHAAGPFEFDISVTREELVEKNLIDGERARPIDNYLALLRYNHTQHTHTDAYVFARDERDPDPRGEDLVFYGVQSVGRLSDSLRYWLNGAYVDGQKDGGRGDISGYGFDAMGTYVIDTPWESSLTAGVAFGSGDDDPTDGVDRNFRQTDLQDNNARFNGLERFKYLGEIVEPEISNMTILTLGAGIRPSDQISADLIYHRYWQVEADDDIRDTNLDLDPNGVSTDLGDEIDVVVGYRPIEGLSITAIGGVFLPGSAFAPDPDPAFLADLEIVYNF